MDRFHLYHKSLTHELCAVKNRIRHLVQHWATDGEWKEAALRTVLRRHLPHDVFVGRGFIVGREYSSTQIDLIILKPGAPTLFRDGDLAIVTPDAPSAIVSVKTRVEGPDSWKAALRELAVLGSQCREISGNAPWLGLFAYEGNDTQGRNALNELSNVTGIKGTPINSVACGKNYFVRYWSQEHLESSDVGSNLCQAKWRLYRLQGLTPSYFVGNVIDAVCGIDHDATDGTWFAYHDGKRAHMVGERQHVVDER